MSPHFPTTYRVTTISLSHLIFGISIHCWPDAAADTIARHDARFSRLPLRYRRLPLFHVFTPRRHALYFAFSLCLRFAMLPLRSFSCDDFLLLPPIFFFLFIATTDAISSCPPADTIFAYAFALFLLATIFASLLSSTFALLMPSLLFRR